MHKYMSINTSKVTELSMVVVFVDSSKVAIALCTYMLGTNGVSRGEVNVLKLP